MNIGPRGHILALLFVIFLSAAPAAAEPPAIWFDRLIGVEPPAPAVEQELARFLTAWFQEPAAGAALPEILAADRAPRMVFVSLSDGRRPARVLRGAGEGAAQAIRQLFDARQDRRAARWVKVDVIRDVMREEGLDAGRPLNLPRSLYGLAFEPEIGGAFLPEELVAETLVDSDQLLRLKKIAARLEVVSQAQELGRGAALRTLGVYRFSTASYFSDAASTPAGGQRVTPEAGQRDLMPLYRGHRDFEEISPELLLDAARWGGQYLIRSVGADGRFVYSYRPKGDTERDRYNMLRHAGTIYSMLELHEVAPRPELLAAAERAIGYLKAATEPCHPGGGRTEYHPGGGRTEYHPGGGRTEYPDATCLVEDGFVKLGGNALAIIALAKHAEVTGSGENLALIGQLGRWILANQSDAGEFTAHKVHLETGRLDDHVSQYYPGEAVLALLRGGPAAGTAVSQRWLEAAAKGARWLIEVRDRKVPDHRLNHDHWLLYGLNELFRRQPEPLYLAHARRTTAAILRLQNRRPIYPDWRGSYYNPPRSTPTATRSEGLAAAYLLERDHGDATDANRLLEGLELGVRFQLQTQFRPESALYLADPQRALGGFRRSLTHYEVRIDYVQHNISALLLLRRILLEQAKTS